MYDDFQTYDKDFANKEEAEQWMEAEVNDPCVDNYRFCFLLNDQTEKDMTDEEMQACFDYSDKVSRGCCGSFDAIIKVNGRQACIGCNYGH